MKYHFLLVTVFALMLTGCVVAPYDLADPEPFNQDAMSALQADISTKEDIRRLFENYTYQYNDETITDNLTPSTTLDGSWWYYSLPRALTAYFWLVANQVDILAGDFGRDTRRSYLLLEFNNSGLLKNYWLTHEDIFCSQTSVCIRDGHFVIPASIEADSNAKLFEPDINHCNLYIYTTRQLKNPINIIEDERETHLGARDAYTLMKVERGSHEVMFYDDIANKTGKLNLACDPPANFIYEYRQNRDGLNLRLISESGGKRAINQKYLMSTLLNRTNLEYDNNCVDVQPHQNFDISIPIKEKENIELEYNRAMEYIAEHNPEAWKHLCIAANSGSGNAQLELAYWHRTDINLLYDSCAFRTSLNRNNRIAYMWYRLAEINGVREAINGKEYMETKLSEQEMEEAIQMVENWQPGQCPAPP